MKTTDNYRVGNILSVRNVIAVVTKHDNGALKLELSFADDDNVESNKIAILFKNIFEMRGLADYIISLARQVEEADNDETESV